MGMRETVLDVIFVLIPVLLWQLHNDLREVRDLLKQIYGRLPHDPLGEWKP